MSEELKAKFDTLKGTIGALPLDHRDACYLIKQIEVIEENTRTPDINQETTGDLEKEIDKCKLRYSELEYKDWEWRSFYNGWLESHANRGFINQEMLEALKEISNTTDKNREFSHLPTVIKYIDILAKRIIRKAEGE